MESMFSSIFSNSPKYTESEKAHLLTVCEKRQAIFEDDKKTWGVHKTANLSDLCRVPYFKARELLVLSKLIKEAVQTGNVSRAQNLAAQQEKVFRWQYLPLRDVAASVLQENGFDSANIRFLQKDIWPKIAMSDCEPTDPPVILNIHPDLRNFLNYFFRKGCPSTDFISADVFNKGYKPKHDAQVQHEMRFLVFEEDGKAAKETNGTAIKKSKELHEYVDAVRDGMNTVSVEADLPEPMTTVSLGFPPRDDFRNPGIDCEFIERNPSLSSTLCSDNFEDGNYVPFIDVFFFPLP